ncbi:hypothetical protein RvY_04823-2 [Ramazzottius varieornatus]|uniref:Uncharacterized protein n=1 Tax=Ramazzottius varieornatus TaxID=947166 RepID=A0A1D1UWF7_RAMVA|nr:hypothetical protein RvY_04823-2 [Ramazzottius varieornatus]
MKGLFGRKKGNAKETDSPGQSLTLDNSSDSVSMASANYGTIAKGVALTNNGMTGANGLQEKAIRPVVRKIGDHKIILWPPDEYFDTVTPKVREPSLEWVYGYSGFSHRNNIVLLHDTAIIVYFVGRIIVLYNLNADTQRHYCEHDGIVQCISVMSNGTIAASGQQPALEDGPAIVRVWTVDHLQTLHVFKSDASMGSALRKSVAALSFTKEEDAIVAIDDGKPRTMSVWSLETGQMLASKPCTESPVVCGILCLRASSKDPLYLVYGRNLMEIWKIVPTENKIDFVKQCVFGQIPKPSIVTSVIEAPVVVDGMPRTVLISGDSDGNVILWSDEMRPKNVLQNGNKVPVFTLCSLSPSHVMIGSRDGQMGVIRLAGESTVKISKNKIPEQYGGLRMLTPMKDSNSDTGLDVSLSVIAGTTANALLRVTFTTTNGEPEADQHDMQAVTVGHFDEAVGLSTYVHPEDNTRTMAITVGMDGNINCFDLAKHAPAWRTFLKDSMVTAVDCYPPFLVVGTSDAKLKLFHLTEPELTLILQASVGKEKVACLKFSPDGTFFAVASQDGEVHIFRLEETEGVSASFVSKFDKHDYPVIAIDWSRNPARDGHYVIHSNSYEFENLLWDALTTEFLEEAHFYRNVKWLTQNCPFGFASATSVTWDNNSLEGNVVCTDVSPTLDMVAAVVTGQRNQIGLYSYPNANVAVVKRMQPTCSTTITSLKLCYLNNTLYLLCTHGGDGSVSQWALR